MKLHGLPNVLLGLIEGLAGCDATRQVRDVGGPIVFGLLEHDRVAFHGASICAFLRIDLSVPIGTSSFRLPGTVTTNGFSGCRNARWLPFCRTCRHCFDSNNLMSSRTFIFNTALASVS